MLPSNTIFSNAATWNSLQGRSISQAGDSIDPTAQMDLWMKFYKKITLYMDSLRARSKFLIFFLILSMSEVMINFKEQMIQKQASKHEMNWVIIWSNGKPSWAIDFISPFFFFPNVTSSFLFFIFLFLFFPPSSASPQAPSSSRFFSV